MLKFFKRKKKNINTEEINNFNNALKVIDDFISIEDFEKAELAINEIKTKETESFNEYVELLKDVEKKSKIEEFKIKLKKIQKIKEKIEVKKIDFEIRFRKKQREIEKKQLENLIKELLTTKNFSKAWEVLNDFLEKNQDNVDTINYVNKKKKYVANLLSEEKRRKEKEIKKNTMLEARELIWELQYDKDNEVIQKTKKIGYFEKIKSFVNLKKKLTEKRLLEEVNLLIQNQNNKNDLIAKAKLEQIHSWISKEIIWEKINWYDLYWKIMWADKISWDALWFSEWKRDYSFFIWDATWHWIKAWITISNLTKKFVEIAKKSNIVNTVIEINNSLKQDLSSWNFITSVFFTINKKDIKELTFVWMWHEPLFVYRKKSKKLEKIIPWWLAAWIRIIKDQSSIKPKKIILDDWDILLSYTDWFTEAKNESWEMYTIDQVWNKFFEFSKNEKLELQDIYDNLLNDLKRFTWWKANYNDDVTILLLKRDKNKEVLDNEDEIEEVILKEWLYRNYKKKMRWKTVEEVKEDIKKIQNETAIKNIIKNLENLYRTWEIIKLKQDSIRYIKEWYIHKKINYYLKKAMDNENSFKIKQKNKKLKDKYNLLKELYKKWDYETVIFECTNIISKDWNI